MNTQSTLSAIHDAIESEHTTVDDFTNLTLPDTMMAAVLLKRDEETFLNMPHAEKDPGQTLHHEEVPLPEVKPGQALVALMASGINHNTVWSSLYEPMSTFQYLNQFAKANPNFKHHVQDYHILGSDGAGVVLRVGAGVTNWKPGNRVTINPCVVDMMDSRGFQDSMMDPSQKAWGYETNFGGLAQFTVVNATQLMPKPECLSWEEAASLSLVSSTCYRMLVSERGARMNQGDNVLVWGGAGGLGALAVQYVLNGGGRPLAVVSSDKKAALVKKQGCDAVINRSQRGYRFLNDDGSAHTRSLVKFRRDIEKQLGGEQPDIVFEHTGRQTFGASVFVARRGGKVVTCGSTTGYEHQFDNRYLWMHLKSIIGSHGGNYHEAHQANRLSCLGKITPVVSDVYKLSEVKEAARKVHRNQHTGKLAILTLAKEEGLGIRNQPLRQKIGEDRINCYRVKPSIPDLGLCSQQTAVQTTVKKEREDALV